MTASHEPGASDPPADIITSAGQGALDEARDRRERFLELTVEKRDIAARERKINAELADLEAAIKDDYAELGTDSMRAHHGDDRYNLNLQPDLWAGPHKNGVDERGNPKATDEDKARANAALRENGLDEYLYETFNSKSLSSYFRGIREEHGPDWLDYVPDELLAALTIKTDMRVHVQKLPKAKTR